MKRFVRRIAFGLAAAAMASACVGPFTPAPTPAPPGTPSFDAQTYMAAIQSRGALRVGIREDTDPLAYRDNATREVLGLEPDIARELARAIFGDTADIDRHVEWVPVLSATRIPKLTDGSVDVVIAALTVSEDRLREIDLSEPYLRTGQRVLMRKTDESIREISDLAQKVVCGVTGSPSLDTIAQRVPTAQRLPPLDTYASCLLALQRGQTDAVTADESTLLTLAKQDPNSKLAGPYLTTETLAVGIKRNINGDRAGFVTFVNEQIGRMNGDGRWAEIYRRWITPLTGEERRSITG